jgi:AcrR family transcriptional regulator
MLDAAEELFLDRGYGGTTMVDIAKAVGVTNAAVYWYLPSKDDALAQVQRRALRLALERAEATPEETHGDPVERLFAFLESESMRGTRAMHRYLHERAEHSASVGEVLDEIHTALRRLIRSAIDSRTAKVSDIDLLVDTCIAILEGSSATATERHGWEMVRFVIEHAAPATRSGIRRRVRAS